LSTVSYALRNDSRLRLSTRERIQAVARRLGYRPNPIFSAMMVRARHGRVNRGEVIAYLSAFPREAQWRRSLPQPEFFAGAKERAEAMSFRLEAFFYAEEGWTERRLEQVLVTRGVRGIIVAPFPRAHNSLCLDWARFAAATIGFTLQNPMLHRVTADHYYNLHLAFASISTAGFHRIGCILPHAVSSRIDQQWMAALNGYQQLNPKQAVPPLVVSRQERSERSLIAWIRVNRPDFLITRESGMSEWVHATLGRNAPPIAELCLGLAPYVSGGIDEHSRLIGAGAIDLVVNQLQHSEFGVPAHPTLTLIPGTWRWSNRFLARTADSVEVRSIAPAP
jgi:LacI family transcriptional regulator